MWNVRANKNVRKVFEIIYSGLRKHKISEFIVSGDGINIRPGNIGPYSPGKPDWAHLDQTTTNDIYECVQGQLVLTNTSASFVATPGSHMYFLEIIKKLKVKTNTNWLKFNAEQLKIIKKITKKLEWQIPINAEKGSMIIWTSSLIHSAKLQNKKENPTKQDKYHGWRGVIYVCYRPLEDFTEKQIEKRQKCYEENRHTNHWSTKIMPKIPGGRWASTIERHENISNMLNDPTIVYNYIGEPILNKRQKRLLGFL